VSGAIAVLTHSRVNRMNFGFHPDRDMNGTTVSAEHHDDTGGYHEKSVPIGFNYRMAFATFTITLKDGKIEWGVGQAGKAPQVL
jgi:hypothetical protein